MRRAAPSVVLIAAAAAGCADYQTLVFQGGGVKGTAYGGAVCALQEAGIWPARVNHLAGSSAGAQVAMLLAAGYSCEELTETLVMMDFSSLLDTSSKAPPRWLGHGAKVLPGTPAPLEDLTRLRDSYGWFKGDALQRKLDDLLQAKLGHANATFADLARKTGNKLRVTATCVTTGRLEWFDAESTPDVPVSWAVRASSSLPFFFTPMRRDDKMYVDGGCLRNLPVDAFPADQAGRTLALGFSAPAQTPVTSFFGFATQLVDTMMFGPDSGNYEGIRPGMAADMVRIDVGTVGTADFGLTAGQKSMMLQAGWSATAEQLAKNGCRLPPAAPSWLVEYAQRSPPPHDWKAELIDQPLQAAKELKNLGQLALQCLADGARCSLEVDPHGTEEHPGFHVRRVCEAGDEGCDDSVVRASALPFTLVSVVTAVGSLLVIYAIARATMIAAERRREAALRVALLAAVRRSSEKGAGEAGRAKSAAAVCTEVLTVLSQGSGANGDAVRDAARRWLEQHEPH